MPTLQLSALQTAATWVHHDLPALPASPTLTNPDMVLPSTGMPPISSPPRLIRRPPSPSYLRERPNQPVLPQRIIITDRSIGPISHPMMLSNARPNNGRNSHDERAARRASSYSSSHRTSISSSTSTLQDHGRLAVAVPIQRSASGSSSSGLSGMTNFLARYPIPDQTSDEDMYDSGEAHDLDQCDTATEMEAEADAQRQKQQVREYNSAILSKRAEQILANAKQRLNVMEGNLRGARDLVAPLTAANLKRAASLGSTQFPPVFGDGYGYEFMRKPMQRTLHTQASSPTMGRDYQAHARGFSETELPERPHTSLEQTSPIQSRPPRLPLRVNEPSRAPGLRGSKSYDALGASAAESGIQREHPLLSRHSRGSPDSGLEPLHEEPRQYSPQPDGSIALGLSRPSSQASDMREQISNLKGRISSLKERAREESLKRQSLQSLRSSSAFSNAVTGVPEGFYTSSSNYSNPAVGTSTSVGRRSNNNSPVTPRSVRQSREIDRSSVIARSPTKQSTPVNKITRTPNSKFQIWPTTPSMHSRNTSRASGVQLNQHVQRNIPEEDDSESPHDSSSIDVDDNQPASSPSSTDIVTDSGTSCAGSEDGDNISIYEDADSEPNQGVAHEDRADAFDYGQFFLHSAMATYNVNRLGFDSDTASITSTETARGPVFDHTLASFPPPTPETPERLRIIEANLHMRPHSSNSATSFTTFATANEDHTGGIRRNGSIDWSRIPRPSSSSSRPNSRPSTAVKRPQKRDSSSERADSGVGLPHHSHQPSSGSHHHHQHSTSTSSNISSSNNSTRQILSQQQQQQQKLTSPSPSSARSSLGTKLSSPTTASSSNPLTTIPQDPSTIIAQALLDPQAQQLGLKDNALLFGVIEGLRKSVRRLQNYNEEGEEGEENGDEEAKRLRRRLEEVRVLLELA